MRIATWNVNSIKQRIDNLTAWLSRAAARLVCLQETKCVDDAFPREQFEALGYNLAVHGQKAFNGVAMLSKLPFDEVTPRLPGEDDRRPCPLPRGGGVDRRPARCASRRSTCPTATRPRRDKYSYKINWMDRLIHYARERLQLEEPLILAGDFNVIPSRARRPPPGRWAGDALFLPRTREKFRALCNLGLTDAVRAVSDGPGPFTFWDYQAGAWQKNNGIRIDHLLLSPQAADRLIGSRHRQACARLGKALGPRPGLGGSLRSALEEAVQDGPGQLVVHADADDVVVEVKRADCSETPRSAPD